MDDFSGLDDIQRRCKLAKKTNAIVEKVKFFSNAAYFLSLYHDFEVAREAQRREEEIINEAEVEADECYESDTQYPDCYYRASFTFNLEALKPSRIWEEFRFTRKQIYHLSELLGLNDPDITGEFEFRRPPLECFCMLLGRLAVPRRLIDMTEIFAEDKTVMSRCVLECARFIYRRFRYLLSIGDYEIPAKRLNILQELGCKDQDYYDNLSFFLDGTVIQVNKPVHGGDVLYNGHKHFHALKYQVLLGTDDIVYSLEGPAVGPAHDSRHTIGVHLEERIIEAAPGCCVYGDEAYKGTDVMRKPFNKLQLHRVPKTHPHLSPEECEKLIEDLKLHNVTMAKARVRIENHFAKINQQFNLFKLTNKNRLGSTPVGILYFCAVFLTNIRTILRRRDLSVRQYLSWRRVGNDIAADNSSLDEENSEEEDDLEWL
ncbi:hypothetical protein DASC09_051750 [Saccharomycopsis crataegensis]|uniref:DDE Tnp4 domain-containing protein n=1 Tax=Saccharomycopsis crataegensis TaxID=43959 RepID=A0AAV5QUI7_9ASCO|nr:hypothetical protein DASC09_051750 [Saccharomycopsis crataegensis]